jgi:hypothetical protein
MGFENSKFISKKFGDSNFGESNFSGGANVGAASGDTDIERNFAWLWEDGSYILWESNDLILLEL